jgi:hypothetical protein
MLAFFAFTIRRVSFIRKTEIKLSRFLKTFLFFMLFDKVVISVFVKTSRAQLIARSDLRILERFLVRFSRGKRGKK